MCPALSPRTRALVASSGLARLPGFARLRRPPRCAAARRPRPPPPTTPPHAATRRRTPPLSARPAWPGSTNWQLQGPARLRLTAHSDRLHSRSRLTQRRLILRNHDGRDVPLPPTLWDPVTYQHPVVNNDLWTSPLTWGLVPTSPDAGTPSHPFALASVPDPHTHWPPRPLARGPPHTRTSQQPPAPRAGRLITHVPEPLARLQPHSLPLALRMHSSLYGTHSWDAHHPPQATSDATPPHVPAAAPQVSLGPRHFSRPAWRAGRPVSSPAGWPTPSQPPADPPQTGSSPTRAPPPLRHMTPRPTLGTTRPGRPVPEPGQRGCAQTHPASPHNCGVLTQYACRYGA